MIGRVCQNQACGRDFAVYPSEIARGGGIYCSVQCRAAVGRPQSQATRRKLSEGKRGRRNPGWRHGRGEGVNNRAGRTAFVDEEARGCRGHRHVARGGRICQHHVVYRQEVQRVGGDIYDSRNALALCTTCHLQHHTGPTRWKLPLAQLRDANYAYARELLGGARAYEYLRRRYLGEDPRLDALLNDEED